MSNMIKEYNRLLEIQGTSGKPFNFTILKQKVIELKTHFSNPDGWAALFKVQINEDSVKKDMENEWEEVTKHLTEGCLQVFNSRFDNTMSALYSGKKTAMKSPHKENILKGFHDRKTFCTQSCDNKATTDTYYSPNKANWDNFMAINTENHKAACTLLCSASFYPPGPKLLDQNLAPYIASEAKKTGPE